MSNRPLDGYPDSWGAHRASVFPVVGPSTYAPYTAPTTGGQVVTLRGPSGVKLADFVQGAVSLSGLYRAEVVQYIGGNVSGVTVARAAVILKWYVVAGGAEAAAIDLSAETVYLLVVGPK